MPLTAGDVLRRKGHQVITIAPEQSIEEAIHTLVTHGVGSLLVVEGDRIAGMLTERDVLRANDRSFDRMRGITVSDLMTREVIIGLVDDSLDYVMDLMTDRHIRHVPIMSGGKLAGILSIGDVVKARSHNAEIVIRYLKDYINGQYPS
jgi:CBS domain-containing protein